jgi:NadR type nicotinamide-nucleotide adenylyltransferase
LIHSKLLGVADLRYDLPFLKPIYSEDYGDRFAHFLGCEHISIDKSRTVFPISGTKVRWRSLSERESAPLQYWQYLEPPVRGWYAKRICLVGAESTGKTTLAKALAAHYLTSWVREYGREYSERKHTGAAGYNWTADEFTHIAQIQADRENAAARHANKILICDTDATDDAQSGYKNIRDICVILIIRVRIIFRYRTNRLNVRLLLPKLINNPTSNLYTFK